MRKTARKLIRIFGPHAAKNGGIAPYLPKVRPELYTTQYPIVTKIHFCKFMRIPPERGEEPIEKETPKSTITSEVKAKLYLA